MKNKSCMLLSAALTVTLFGMPCAVSASGADSSGTTIHYVEELGIGSLEYELNSKTKEAALVKVPTVLGNDGNYYVNYIGVTDQVRYEGKDYTLTQIGSYDENGNGVSIFDENISKMDPDANSSIDLFSYGISNKGDRDWLSMEQDLENLTVCENAFAGYSGEICLPSSGNLKWGIKADGSKGSAVGDDFEGILIGPASVKSKLGNDKQYFISFLEVVDYDQQISAGQKISTTFKKGTWWRKTVHNAYFNSALASSAAYIMIAGTQYPMEYTGEDENGNGVFSTVDPIPASGKATLHLGHENRDVQLLSVEILEADPSVSDDSGETAQPETGWKQLDNGNWIYLESDVRQIGWKKLNGDWYFFDEEGIMKSSGWLKEGNDWYFMGSSGRMKTGWVKDGDYWYYMTTSGRMASSRWIYVNNTWYYMTSSGAMKTGWLKLDNTWYFLKSDGAMLANTTMDGYHFDADGRCTNPY